ncbi:MAG: ankyrin repeat domain-containing protein [Bryobacterales bacterium]|nr:ankyrin repeat domain-containing protein [Bryobacterales bacterium]
MWTKTRFQAALAVAAFGLAGFTRVLAGVAGSGSLVEAARQGNRQAAIALIEQHVNVNEPMSDGTTALAWAAHNGDVDLVDRLLRAGADAKSKNQFGATPMSEAAFAGNFAIIEKLLNAGADPDSPAADGETALMVVARTDNVPAAELLLKHGAHVDAREKQKDQTALMWASAESQPAMVRELIAHGADVNAHSLIDEDLAQVSSEPRAQHLSYGGFTPLLYATREGCLSCVKTLVEGGAKLNLPDPEGVTPLIMAITNAHFDTAAYLLEKGANVDKWDWWGRSPLYCAVDMNTIPHGGRADGPSLDETTPLQIIEQLLDKGANPNLQLKLLPPFRSVGADRGVDQMLTIGATPLLRAAKALDAPAIKLLLAHGALVNLPNIRGTTPTMAAAGLGSVDADTRGVYTTPDVQQRSLASLELLLAAGGEINAADSRGQTPLHAAAFWGWNDVVQFLVAHHANLNAVDLKGKSPIDSAMGRAGGNSRGGQRIDVHADTAALLQKLGETASK